MCEYTHPRGMICKYQKLLQSDFCHLKSHYPSLDNYKKIIDIQEQNFMDSTIRIPNRNFYNPPMNGACMYYCFANYIQSYGSEISSFFSTRKEIEFIKENIDIINFSTMTIDQCAASIQKMIKNYIVQHKENIIPQNDITWEHLVRACHCLSIEDYNRWFEIPAVNADRMIINGRNVDIPLRWGTTVELLAFCVLFEINADIYIPMGLNKQYQMVEMFYQLEKTRFKLIENIRIYNNEWKSLKLIHYCNHYLNASDIHF